jgi:hypothetical protein
VLLCLDALPLVHFPISGPTDVVELQAYTITVRCRLRTLQILPTTRSNDVVLLYDGSLWSLDAVRMAELGSDLFAPVETPSTPINLTLVGDMLGRIQVHKHLRRNSESGQKCTIKWKITSNCVQASFSAFASVAYAPGYLPERLHASFSPLAKCSSLGLHTRASKILYVRFRLQRMVL